MFPVTIEDKIVHLNAKEFAFYSLLLEREGHLVPTKEILSELQCTLTYLRVTKKSVDEKIAGTKAKIHSIYGKGYILSI